MASSFSLWRVNSDGKVKKVILIVGKRARKKEKLGLRRPWLKCPHASISNAGAKIHVYITSHLNLLAPSFHRLMTHLNNSCLDITPIPSFPLCVLFHKGLVTQQSETMLLSPFLPLWTTSSPLSDSLQSIFNGSSQPASIIRGSLQSDTDVSAIKVGI